MTQQSQAHEPATPDEQRALSRDEQELADQARNPALQGLSDRELGDLVSLLRERRNRARDIADRQRREARGKAEPAGASAAGGNEGTMSKHDYLGEALDRAMAERDRRAGGAEAEAEGGETQADLARKAQAMAEAGRSQNPMMEDGAPLHPADPDASSGKAGMAATERNTAPSGALDHAGEGPSRERSRTRY
ncbi:hypothetical protein [Paracoccus tibetensis]|uniref:Uncharacterized protein n=1 Tax=Paracoccus tibetensis TaxID=336292 RepID=A0A1G5ICU6_9RHOB|nr:hypothetical protein [Paracoccus tibetensis]SCY73976.1 hypothetical protein SAMN05660710_02601 [Paracoccus tibetensis]